MEMSHGTQGCSGSHSHLFLSHTHTCEQKGLNKIDSDTPALWSSKVPIVMWFFFFLLLFMLRSFHLFLKIIFKVCQGGAFPSLQITWTELRKEIVSVTKENPALSFTEHCRQGWQPGRAWTAASPIHRNTVTPKKLWNWPLNKHPTNSIQDVGEQQAPWDPCLVEKVCNAGESQTCLATCVRML